MGVGAGLYMYFVVVQKFTFAISSPDEFLFQYGGFPPSWIWDARVWTTHEGHLVWWALSLCNICLESMQQF